MKRRQQLQPHPEPQLRRSQLHRVPCSPQALLDALTPILPLFHSFLSDADAARLLRTSRTVALALLPGYAFTSHTFEPASDDSLLRLRDLCVLYRLRVSQLGLPYHMPFLTFDAVPPHLSPIPATVTALECGSVPWYTGSAFENGRWATFSAAAAAGDWQGSQRWRLPEPHPSSSSESLGEEEKQRQLASWVSDIKGDGRDGALPQFEVRYSALNCPLPPGLLPLGLRVLQLGDYFNQSLQPGSLPPTLTFLQLGDRFDQPLTPSVLPASLRYLCVHGPMQRYHQLLLPSLPASLERLSLCEWPHPLEAGVWPAALKALHLGNLRHPLQAHVLPSSLLYLSFDSFEDPLLPGVLPSSLVELRLDDYNQPLPPGVLPSSLRKLTLGGQFCQPLQAGSLPEGLLFLCLRPGDDRDRPMLPPLQAGVLPPTLLGLDLTNRYHQHPLEAGTIPPAVRWVQLPSWYRDENNDIEAVLPVGAEISWWCW